MTGIFPALRARGLWRQDVPTGLEGDERKTSAFELSSRLKTSHAPTDYDLVIFDGSS
jgi:hypothetical protein